MAAGAGAGAGVVGGVLSAPQPSVSTVARVVVSPFMSVLVRSRGRGPYRALP